MDVELLEDFESNKENKISKKCELTKKSKKMSRCFCFVMIIVVIVGALTFGGFMLFAWLFPHLSKYSCKNNYDPTNFKTVAFLEDETGYWTFQTDDDFVILQLTDTHLTGSLFKRVGDKKSLAAIKTLVERVKPNLVIITGDIAHGHIRFSKNVYDETKMVGELMDSLNVYWTVTLGNHDSSDKEKREGLIDVYQSCVPLCLFQRGPTNIHGIGNTFINLKNSEGRITQSLVLVDSNMYKDGGFDNIHEDQINWYEQEIKRMNEINKEKVDSLMFMHIPMEEYKIAYKKYISSAHNDEDENREEEEEEEEEEGAVRWLGGVYVEKISNSKIPDNMFETIVKLNSTRAVFCGHNHLNHFGVEYKNVALIFGMSIDYNSYGDCCTEQRGGTVITVHRDGTYNYEYTRLE